MPYRSANAQNAVPPARAVNLKALRRELPRIISVCGSGRSTVPARSCLHQAQEFNPVADGTRPFLKPITMLIYVFVPNYPSLYKPYYDGQFADLIRRGHDVRIFAGSNLDAELNEKVVQFGLDQRTRPYYPSDLRSLPRFAPALAGSLLRRPWYRCAIAGRLRQFAHSWKGWGKHSARMLSLPTAVPDLCLVHSVRTMALFPWLTELYPGVPIALFYHGGGLHDGTQKHVFGPASVVFTNTDYSVSEAVSLGCPKEKTVILPVGFDLADYQVPKTRSYRPNGVLRLLSASRLGEEKGHTFALEAISVLVRSGFRHLHYTIIGGGRVEMKRMLERRVQELELGEFVTFAGAPPTRTVIAAMGEADVLLLPSFEYRGIVEMQAACVQEAALMGALAITTHTGGVPESTPPAFRPFSVPCKDPEAIAESIRRMDRLTSAQMAELATIASSWVAERYDVRMLNERMLREVARRSNTDLLPART